MKDIHRHLMLAATVAVLLAAAFFVFSAGQAANPAAITPDITNASNGVPLNSTAETLRQVSADELAANPAAFLGKRISVGGPVGNLLPDKGMFMLVCSCGQALIPVSYNGTLPAQGRQVAAQGVLRQDADGKFYFGAERWSYSQ